MPIRFRCSYCNRLLGIATRKAGMETTCPHCGYTITVPIPQEDDGRTERMNLDDVDAALGRGGTEILQPPAAVAAAEKPPADPPKPQAPRPRPNPPALPKPAPKNPDERPLFEKDMDDILGKTAVPAAARDNKPKAVSGMDAMSLGEPASHQIVLSAGKATLLLALVAILLIGAFAAGYFVRG